MRLVKPLHIRLIVTDAEREDVAAVRAALRAAGHVVVDEDLAQLPTAISAAPDFVITEAAAQPVPESLAGAESRHLRATLRFTHGNRRQAALLLGVARSTLLAKMRRYGLE